MTKSLRTRSALILLATVTLTAGCGGAADKLSAARSDVAGAAAAATSAEAAIAALSSKLAALTSATPVPVPSAAATSAAAPTPSASAGGLPAVPSGAALSSLLATPASSTPAPAATDVAAAPSGASAVLGGALAALDVTKQCAAIPTAQVQALIKKPIGAPRNEPEQCGWAGTDLHITLTLNDADKHSYNYLVGSGDHPIAGLGDVAEWSEPVPGKSLPDVNAHKGQVTCYVQATDVPLSTIAYTGSDPFFTITDAASLAYAMKEAALCADLFKVTT